ERARAIAPHQLRPSAGQQRAEEADRFGDAEKWSRIVGAAQVEQEAEARSIGAVRIEPVADRERQHPVLPVAAHVQESRSFRRAQPFGSMRGLTIGARSGRTHSYVQSFEAGRENLTLTSLVRLS